VDLVNYPSETFGDYGMERHRKTPASTACPSRGKSHATMSFTTSLRSFFIFACLVSIAVSSLGQGSAFTYQGRLTDGGAPASGAYDFRFILYNAEVGGSQVGTTFTAEDLAVTGGVFTVTLDFGPNIFDGQARWLELAVRQGASTGIYTVLSPRQPVTPTPYSMFAAKAGGLANGSITAGQLAPGAVTAAAIASGAITADKIPDGAITTNKLSASALAGLGGTPPSTVLMSQDPNATNLTAAGYVRLSGELLANQSEVVSFAGTFQPLSLTDANRANYLWTGSDLFCVRLTTNLVGYRYNLASNRFDILSATGAPQQRDYFSAVWTGTELIVWGGSANSTSLNTGGRYRPSNDTWQPMATAGAPTGRGFPSAVWTGTEMIVWGGYNYNTNGTTTLRNGGRYNPTFDSWLPMSSVNAPGTNGGFYFSPWAMAWTGSRMLVWSSINGVGSFGGLYDPVNDSWLAISTVNAPANAYPYSAVWTGTHLVVHDGSDSRLKRYSPATNTWETLPTAPGVVDTIGVWTGSSLAYFQDYGYGGLGSGVNGSVMILDWPSLAWTAKTYGKPYSYTSQFVAWIGDSALHFAPNLPAPLLRSRLQNPLYLYLKP
jgi:hypothetical protein